MDSDQNVYHFHATATGEARDAKGRLLDARGSVVKEGTAQITGTTTTPVLSVPLVELAAMTDDQLRAHRVDDPTIADIRRKIAEQENQS